MNRHARPTAALIGAAILLLPLSLTAFNSGSTGADGAFSPFLTNTELQLPPDGVFNFTSVNIPVGVTVTFKRNAANTPVVMLVQGDVLIDGTLDVSGKPAAPTGSDAPDGGDPTDDGMPGEGGPGGFSGGYGTPVSSSLAPSDGLGPGGGRATVAAFESGSGGSHATAGAGTQPGTIYGSQLLRPLVGGSGGGGTASFWWPFGPSSNQTWVMGMGGGGGGGAILVAASGDIHLNGLITANGGGSSNDQSNVSTGGGGSGGAIRLVAAHIVGGGRVTASGGNTCCGRSGFGRLGGTGGTGRIRVEPETGGVLLLADPGVVFDRPADLFTPGLPGLAISSIATLPVPTNPTGRGDITLPAITADPVDVVLHTNGVPPDTIIKLTVTPEYGAATSTDSAPTVGTLADASTTVSVSIPEGRSVLMATTSFIVTAALGEHLAPYAQGETVEQVRLTASPGQPSRMVLLTASGRELDLPAGALAQGW
ncbi:hypothetical protein [uncultured Lamprocystis sp.]|jgi:hypothetical protein|uniref:hypothetical protein n=1 Tax=uncultured Lamprocystis sp. TaxID=543132 RepID=UPI0025EF727E|nr:hypothetical protein [uncultured Lamprocystis sp.]